MTHRLWYISLGIEATLLGVLAWRQTCAMFASWLAFDIVTGLFNVWMDRFEWSHYQISWGIKQPIAMGLRVLAARDVWRKLGGRIWSRACVGLSAFICIAQMQSLPKTVIEAEFMGIAISSASLAMILWLSLRAAWKLTADPLVIRHAYVMCGYFTLTAICYYAAWGYRQDIGRATGIVAILSYSAWLIVFARRREA